MRYLNQYVWLRAAALDYLLVVDSSISRKRAAVAKFEVRPLCVADRKVIPPGTDAVDVLRIHRHVEAELELGHAVVLGPWHVGHCLAESAGIIIGDVG